MSDLTDAQAQLTAVTSAYTAALDGQTVQYGDKRITRQNVDILLDQLNYWTNKVNALTAADAGLANPGVMTPKWS